MKTAWTLAVSGFILLISFQNCQKPPHPDEIAGQNLYSSGTVNKVDLNQESVQTANFMVPDLKSVTHSSGNVYQVKYNKILNIDLASGAITETSDYDSSSRSFCLSDDMKDELVSLLKSSQVCQMGRQSAAGQVCDQSVRVAYAEIVTDREQYNLGWASDGCGNNSVDLCADQATHLKAYIQALNSQYESMSCN